MSNNKLEIFNSYSQNLELVLNKIAPERINEYKNKYMCPFCRRLFSIESLNTKLDEHLTIEDIPPKSVGWKKKILTCKTCNNSHGGIIDSHLPVVTNYKAFSNRTTNKSINIRLKFYENLQLNAELIYKGNDLFEIKTNPKLNNPSSLDHFNFSLEKGGLREFQIQWKSGNLKKAKLSIIRAAYLWGLCELGYAFILNPYFNNINEQLLDYSKNLIPPDSVITKKENQLKEGIYLFKMSEEVSQYAISMSIKSNEYVENVIVFFPTPNDTEQRALSHLRDIISAKSKKAIQYIDLNNLSILNHSENCILPLVGFGR